MARRAALPAVFEPQLATLVDEPPAGDGWVHELKYDGYRIGCRVDGDEVCLLSRRGKDWTAAFPELVAAARALLGGRRALLDGEAAIVLPDGRTSFQALQNALGGGSRRGLTYFAFDLLHLDGEDLSRSPLDERKARLEALIGDAGGIIRYSDHVVGDGPAFFAQVCKVGVGFEGIVSKQRACPYQAGRTTTWLKVKCIRRQEFVVGGFTDPEGSREGLGALLIGVRGPNGRLAFAGKVGTGFTQRSARELRRRLDGLEREACPFSPRPDVPPGPVHWVEPVLVAEVAFAEWTAGGKVRHPSFKGLREDKPAAEVTRERPVTAKRGSTPAAEVAGVRISNPDRVLYPQAGLTKLDVARYYEAIAAHVVPHVAGRPLTLVRCPKGIAGEGGEDRGKNDCFFMKHSGVWAPEALRRVAIRERTKTGTYLVADDLAGVIALVQMDVLEIHTWNSRVRDLERPDRVVFDLDPGPDVPWADVVQGARLLRATLGSLGLDSFVKTTGGKGLHVVVPLRPERSWDECLAFTRDLSGAVAAAQPDRYTIAVAKAGRERKILIDYLRNNRANTSVAAFSTRARPIATVSVPLAWSELTPALSPGAFTVATVPPRLRRQRRDPWAGYAPQRLTAAMLHAAARVGPAR